MTHFQGGQRTPSPHANNANNSKYHVSKENLSNQVKKIMYISGLKGPIFYGRMQLTRTNVPFLYRLLSFYEMKPFTRAIRKTAAW